MIFLWFSVQIPEKKHLTSARKCRWDVQSNDGTPRGFEDRGGILKKNWTLRGVYGIQIVVV